MDKKSYDISPLAMHILNRIDSLIKIDHLHILFAYKDNISVFDPNSNRLEPLTISEPSITETALVSKLPLIENRLFESFLYNPSCDNPFGYEANALAAIPIILENQSSPCALIALFKSSLDDCDSYFKKGIIKELSVILQNEFIKSDLECDRELIVSLSPTQSKIENSHSDTQQLIARSNEFFSSIIHDIRTPMNAIMGFLELLQEQADPKQRDWIKAAYKSGEMIVALINDVLDFNKIISGKLDVDFHYFSPVEELKNSALIFYHSAREKRIDLIVYFDPAIPYVIKSDPKRLKQIVNNLLSNAIKFTPKEGMVVLEMLYNSKNDTLKINVIDTGIGIDPEAQKRLFKPFVQASKSTSSHYGGTGLGLSISKKLSQLLGGELSINSREGKGSTFTLEIPCHSIPGTPSFLDFDFKNFPYIYLVEGTKSKHRYINYYERYFKELNLPHEITTPGELIKRDIDDKNSTLIGVRFDYEDEDTRLLLERYHNSLILLETQLYAQSSQIPDDITILDMPVFPQNLFETILNIKKKESLELHGDRKSDKRVLLVDDSPINLKLMDEIAQRLGAKTFSANDGQEAIEIFEKEKIDIILIDQNMPTLNGTEAIRKIRSLPQGEDVLIYGLTGDADNEILRQMRQAGANAVLSKPVQIKKLREILYG